MSLCYFLHGLGSAPGGPAIEGIDAQTGLQSIRLSYLAEESWQSTWVNLLEQSSAATEDSIFIGLSMGGFFAAQLSAVHKARCYLLNPVIAPAFQLARFVGPFNAGGRAVEITEEGINSFLAASDPRREWNHKRVGLMLSTGDTVLTPRHAEVYYKEWAAFVDIVDDVHAIGKEASLRCIAARIQDWR